MISVDVILQVYFHDIPDEVIDSLVRFRNTNSLEILVAQIIFFGKLLFMNLLYQTEDEITLNVSGGLMLEHPLTLRFVEQVVRSLSLSLSFSCPCMHQ